MPISRQFVYRYQYVLPCECESRNSGDFAIVKPIEFDGIKSVQPYCAIGRKGCIEACIILYIQFARAGKVYAAVTAALAKTTTTRYDVAEHLRTPKEMAAYLEACFEEANGDAAFIAKALGDIARAKGMSQVAKDAGLSRESLYKALSGERSPGFDTIRKVMGALGLKLHA